MMDKLGQFLKGDEQAPEPAERERSGDEVFELEKLLIKEPTLQRYGSSSRSINSAQSMEYAAKKRSAKLEKYSRKPSDDSSVKESDFKALVDFSKMTSDRTTDFNPFRQTEPFTAGIIEYDSSKFAPQGPSKAEKQRQRIIEIQKKREQAMKAARIIRPTRIQLKPYQIDELKEAFNLLENGQEMMDVREAISILRACGVEPDHEQTKEIFKEIKPGNEDFINCEELIRLFSVKLQKKDPTCEIRRAFKMFDINNSGLITLDNLREISRIVGEDLHEEELKEMIEAVDVKDKKGVNLDSFVKLMRRKEWFD